MFKNLKEQIVTKANQTNQILYSAILSNNSASSSSNHDDNRSRLDSAASDISQTANYVSPVRQSFPPSDIESEHGGGDESDHETISKMQKLLNTYKNKFSQLKKAYDEVEHEKDNIKDVLQKYQDAAIKRKGELREQITREQQANAQLKSMHQKEIKLRDQQIEELTKDREEVQIQREKRVQLIQERDFLLQKLNEKQTMIKDPTLEADLQSAKQQIAELQQSLFTQNEQHSKSFDALKTEYENLTNELHQTKQAKDHIQSLLDQTINKEHTDDPSKAALTKLQHDYDESLANCAQLTQTLDVQNEEIATLKTQQQTESREEFENTHKEQISALENELKIATKRFQDETIELSSEINRLQQLLDEQMNKSNQYEEELKEKYSQLEIQFNKILSEKSELENQLDNQRLQIQTSQELEIERDSYRKEIETLKNEIISLVNLNEENTRRIDEFDNEKFHFEQEIIEKDRQITERDEKIGEIQSALEQSKESNEKLGKALQKMKESIETNWTDKTSVEIRLQKLTEDYEQRLKEQENEYDVKLKAMAKEMSTQIDQKEQNYKQQLHDFIQNNQKIESELVNNSEQRLINAEQRALVAEEQMSKLDEQLKEKQLDHYRVVQDLQNQIRTLKKEKPPTMEQFSQTINEHSHLVELTEMDYLKQIFHGYMTGKDPITMVKVICAVLRCTEDETSSIIEHEKLRQSRWLNSSR